MTRLYDIIYSFIQAILKTTYLIYKFRFFHQYYHLQTYKIRSTMSISLTYLIYQTSAIWSNVISLFSDFSHSKKSNYDVQTE